MGHDVTLFASGDSITARQLVALRAHGAAARRQRPRSDPLLHADARPGAPAPPRTSTSCTSISTSFISRSSRRWRIARSRRCTAGRTCPDLQPLYRGLSRHAAGLDLRRAARAGAERELRGHRPSRAAARSATRRRFAPRGGYLAFLGRISPEKRPDRAIAIARRARHSAEDRRQGRPRRRGLFPRRDRAAAADGPASSSSARSASAQKTNSSARRARCCSRSTGRSRSAW